MAQEPVDRNERDQRLSALADGELDPRDVPAACALWREDEQARQRWHAYQLIGDVLRSDDLAAAPTRDEAFLQALRARLQQEPVVLAPAPASVPAPKPARARWTAPVAVAAGFMAVAGVLVVTRLSAPLPDSGAAASLAAAGAAPTVSLASNRASAPAGADEPALAVNDMRILRDARLDSYLAAHKQYGSPSTVAVPAVSLRQATLVPER